MAEKPVAAPAVNPSTDAAELTNATPRRGAHARRNRFRERLLATARLPAAQTLLATLVYTILAIQVTWPLATDLDFRIFGAFGDLTGSMATMRAYVDGHHNPFLPGHLPEFSAPDGRPIEWTQNVASFSSTGLLYLLTMAFGVVPAYGLFVLLGFVASGAAMFLLVRRTIGASFWVSLLIGWAFAFYPFAVIKAGGHVHFTHGWPFVLIFWRMFVLYESPTVRNGVLAGLATVLAISWSPYFLLIGGVAYAALFVAGIVVPLVRARGHALREAVAAPFKAQGIGAAIVLAFAVALVGVTILSSRGTGTVSHSLDALYVYSARPFEYLVPPAGNWIVGDETGPWLADHLHGSNFAENTLYVGLSLVLLSIVALWAAARRRLSERLTIVVAASAFTGIVALAFSAPPRVAAFGKLIPFPALLTHDLSGAWRVYARFVMVVMLAVCVLAAIGLDRIVRRRPPLVQALILVAVAVVVVVDLRTPPIGTNTLDVPPVYPVLKRQPPGLVAEYPIEPTGFGDYSAEFYQQLHGKPIINGYTEGSLSEKRALELTKLDRATTPGRLRMLGVRYVVVTHVPIDPPVQAPGKPGTGLRLLFPGKYASLYAVDARPEPMVTMGPGFSPPERDKIGPLRWLSSDEGEIEVMAPCSPCVGTLNVVATSFVRPRSIRLTDPDGRTLSVRRVGVHRQRVSFPVRFDRRAVLTVTTSPNRESVRQAYHGGTDPRSLSVSIVKPQLHVQSRGTRGAS
jgi:hypothetical protein